MKTEKVYSINFDFRKQEQRRILEYMQRRGYKLLGFKGAESDGQVEGVPVWLSVPYIRMSGEVKNICQSRYKVYYMEASPAADNSIRMKALSRAAELGSRVILQEDNSFTVEPGAGSEHAVLFINNRAAGSGTITVGLASPVNGAYAPFCAFKVEPRRTLTMVPNDKICLFALPTAMRTGTVAARAVTEGTMFEFNAPYNRVHLEMKQDGDGFTPLSWGLPMKKVHSGDSLVWLMDHHHFH